jgi:hypothetical protein
MSEDIRTSQRRLIAGVAVLALLFILVVVALIRSIQPRGGDPHVGHRSPAAALAYCVPQDTKLCVVSFGQVEGGDMQVNFQIPRLFYPEFILVINRFGVETTYECKETKGVSMGVTCAGTSQVPGEILQFKVISIGDGTLLAEGKFPIIGIAIFTPEDLSTPTATATETPIGSGTENPFDLTPFPTEIFQTPAFSTPTFPSTSYPNPSSYP